MSITINRCLCKKSGLAFRWAEESMPSQLLGGLTMEVHPLFQGENYLKVERLAMARHGCATLTRELMGALCMFKLTQLQVITPRPSPETLNKWGQELAQQMDQYQLRRLYIEIIETHSPTLQETSPFQFNLESIESLKRLLWLISKCTREQIAELQEQALAKEASEAQAKQAAKQVEAQDTEVRQIAALSTVVIQGRVSKQLREMQVKITFPQPKHSKIWTQMRKQIESGDFLHIDPEQQEKAFKFLFGWGMKQAQSKGYKESDQARMARTLYMERVAELELWSDIEENS